MRIISGKAAQCKLLWIGNKKTLGRVGIVLAKKMVDKVINLTMVSDSMKYVFMTALSMLLES